jgi:hypothetical protein
LAPIDRPSCWDSRLLSWERGYYAHLPLGKLSLGPGREIADFALMAQLVPGEQVAGNRLQHCPVGPPKFKRLPTASGRIVPSLKIFERARMGGLPAELFSG